MLKATEIVCLSSLCHKPKLSLSIHEKPGQLYYFTSSNLPWKMSLISTVKHISILTQVSWKFSQLFPLILSLLSLKIILFSLYPLYTDSCSLLLKKSLCILCFLTRAFISLPSHIINFTFNSPVLC